MKITGVLFALIIQYEYTPTQFKEGASDPNFHLKTLIILLCCVFVCLLKPRSSQQVERNG